MYSYVTIRIPYMNELMYMYMKAHLTFDCTAAEEKEQYEKDKDGDEWRFLAFTFSQSQCTLYMN